MELIDILTRLDAPLVIIVGVFVVRYLTNQIEKKDKELEKLNTYIRTSNEANIKTLSEFSRFLETLISDMKDMKGDVVQAIAQSATEVKLKMDNLKDIIQHNGKS